MPFENPTDFRVTGATLWLLPVTTRVPLKFGTEALTSVTCARVRIQVVGRDGRTADGWGETPLSVQWVWPSTTAYGPRHSALCLFTEMLTHAWANFADWGHPVELGYDFATLLLPRLWEDFNSSRLAAGAEGLARMPWLAALVASSAFDLALHDAYGRLHCIPTYDTYRAGWMRRNLSDLITPAPGSGVDLRGREIRSFLRPQRVESLRAWHLVGGLDPVMADELTGSEPKDGHPVLLEDWIRRDGLKCLKVKLRGTDAAWDLARLLAVGRVAEREGVEWLTADFNCTVSDPAYVTEILDRLRDDHPRLYGSLLYVEQPFPYELEEHPIDVHAVASRKPLFLDESAHDWTQVRRGRELGWNGVALKTCKTQTGALLSACWAQAHGMTLMVQDLTNPMLAQVTHALLAAHVPTIMGIETNGMQFYPEASAPEAQVHPELYRRRDGGIRLETVRGTGFGHRMAEVVRELPEPGVEFEG
jgi:L-alanine-DL-glutamate epimerase-like enolase superfamily enzyme